MATIYLYPRWLRFWHLLNALLYVLLIITGVCMQYSSREFSLIPFETSISIHNWSGVILTINYLFFILFNSFSPNRRFYSIDWKGMGGRLFRQARFYLYGIFKGEDGPFPVSEKRKFNPLQKLSYIFVLYFFMPLMIVSGWALIFPEIVIFDQVLGTSGLHFTDLVHIISGFILSVFFVIHLYLCFLVQPPGSSFRAMLSGWHQS